MSTLTVDEVMDHRKRLRRYLENVPEAWFDLDVYVAAKTAENGRSALVTALTGTRCPTNTCGAVGCFLGGAWTFKHYQDWCDKHTLPRLSGVSMTYYLGLPDTHNLFTGRQYPAISQKTEVFLRLDSMDHASVWIFGKKAQQEVCG